MDPLPGFGPRSLLEHLLAQGIYDGSYVVVVMDPHTGEADAHGPYDGLGATLTADKFRRDFDGDDLPGIEVRVIRLQHPTRLHAE